MTKPWSRFRTAAHRGELSHAQLLSQLQAQAALGHWARIERWLPLLLLHGVGAGERQGSRIATADWLQRQRRSALAHDCLNLVDWQQADGHVWLLRGQVAKSLGQIAQAQHHWIRALMLPKVRSAAAYRLGQLQRSAGDFDQAAAWFLASLQADPKPFHVHNDLHYTRCSEALLPELVAFYAHLCAKRPRWALSRQLLAHYLAQSGDLEGAIRESRRAARLGLAGRSSLLSVPDQQPTPPDFLILGVPKGGTTATLRWLEHQQGLWCHPRKELHFFDVRYHHGHAWYCAQFPRFQESAGILRGEATPNYFSHSESPARVAALMARVRLVVLLRDPLQRAISWVQHLQRLEGLKGTVESWLQHELNSLQHLAPDELAQHPRVGTGALQDSCYDLHLQRWQQTLPEAPMLLLSSDRLFQDPAPQLRRLLAFLEQADDPSPWLEQWRPLNVNPDGRAQLSAELQQELRAFLSQHCQQSWSALTDNQGPPWPI